MKKIHFKQNYKTETETALVAGDYKRETDRDGIIKTFETNNDATLIASFLLENVPSAVLNRVLQVVNHAIEDESGIIEDSIKARAEKITEQRGDLI